VIADALRGPAMRRELERTGRLPESVDWLQLNPGDTPFRALLSQLSWEAGERRILIGGGRTYHPSLHRLAAEWSGDEDAVALATDGHDRLAAECKLDGWLVKPTDGFFAQMNRKVSIPISRQLIRFPITPNMISLFTLGVSFLSGLLFARGGYLNMLFGALLGRAASILDGCDGEVARLKLQDSAFGCWLETVCDYLYYLFMFAGMTIGLLKNSGTRLYLVLGGLLLLGALLSFLVSSLQRRRMTAADRLEQFLANWQKEASSRSPTRSSIWAATPSFW
jgi:phosphatidylglycerophosphate synthase